MNTGPRRELKHFYKYMSTETAMKVLKTKTLRWSSPLLFNDPFDVPRKLIPDMKYENIKAANPEVIKEAILNPDIDIQYFRENFQEIINKGRRGDEQYKKDIFAKLDKPSLETDPDIFEVLKGMRQEWCEKIIPNMRILCLSTEKDITPMWYHYADKYQGVVLDILIEIEVDNRDLDVHYVKYYDQPPPLFTEKGWARMLMLEENKRFQEIDTDYIYSKQHHWSYEKEWRTWDLEKSYNKNLYTDHPLPSRRFSKIYFGPEIKHRDRKNLMKLTAKELPHVEMYDMSFKFGWKAHFEKSTC